MPLYTYACPDCETAFEVLAPSRATAAGESAVPECPSCGGTAAERRFGVPGNVKTLTASPAGTNCRGDGPPCGAPYCGRGR